MAACARIDGERESEVAAAEMFQSPMLRSQSSIRLPKYAGVHSMVALASRSLGLTSSTQ